MIEKIKEIFINIFNKIKEMDKEILIIIIIIIIAFIYFGVSQIRLSKDNINVNGDDLETFLNDNNDNNNDDSSLSNKNNIGENGSNNTLENTSNVNNYNNDDNDKDSGLLKLSEKDIPKIYVHIDGEVKKPGVLELSEGDRLITAVKKAGGLKEEADTKVINLAMKLEDGSKVYIPSEKETKEDALKTSFSDSYIISGSNPYAFASVDSPEASNYSSSNTSEVKKGKVNINKASKEELETLNGIGSSTAEKIIEYRKKVGKFKKKDELLEVKGIGESKYNKIKDYIKVN